SPEMISTRSRTAARLSRLPVLKLSSTRTVCPAARSASTRCEPRKPAPPVTREVVMGDSFHRDVTKWAVWKGQHPLQGRDYLFGKANSNHFPPRDAQNTSAGSALPAFLVPKLCLGKYSAKLLFRAPDCR